MTRWAADPRNACAAERLRQIADEVANPSDNNGQCWSNTTAVGWTNERWHEALSVRSASSS
jgi:hypothetical protein